MRGFFSEVFPPAPSPAARIIPIMKNNTKIALKASVCLFVLALLIPSVSIAEGFDAYRARVASVASRLEPVMGLSPKIYIKDDKSQSAFVLPNGTVVISTSLLESAASDDEVAFVLAHEASHILAKDQLPGPGADLMGLSDPTKLQLNEIRADASALSFMQGAGYDPGAALNMLKRLSTESVNLTSRIKAISGRLGL